jgi:uncharacterized protein YhbP (UPF0306 family)
MEIRVGDKDIEEKKVRKSVEEILGQNKLLSMSTTSENQPHINTAFYAADELNLYIFTPPETTHSQNIAENPEVAVDIHDSHQNWADKKRGLQIFGEAEKADQQKALKTYKRRFPEMKELAEKKEELEQYDSEFYILKPEKIKIFDEPRFGKETWINAEVVE